MTKPPKFRSRKIDFRRALPVYRAADIPDFDEAASLARAVPLVETGVEKEEEEEHHLQAAISALHASYTSVGTKPVASLVIPTPDASRTIQDYDTLYPAPRNFSQPTTLMRFSATVEDSCGCPYTIDEEDDQWTEKYNGQQRDPAKRISVDVMESCMWTFEQLTWDMVMRSKEDVPSFERLQQRAVERQIQMYPLAHLIYPHWLNRRITRNFGLILPVLKTDDALRNESDPYVCFRKREVRPMRKTRRTDMWTMDKARKLRNEMETAKSLLEMVCKRERMMKESLTLERLLFGQKCTVLGYRRKLHQMTDIEELFHVKKQRKLDKRTTITLPLKKLRKSGDLTTSLSRSLSSRGISSRTVSEARQKRDRMEGWLDFTQDYFQPFPWPLSHLYYQPLASLLGEEQETDKAKQPQCSHMRLRMGRGGRLYMDRRMARSDLLQHLHAQSPEMADRWKYDEDVREEEEERIVDLEAVLPSFVRQRSRLLSDTDLRSLSAMPSSVPVYLSSSSASVPSGRPREPPRPSGNAVAQPPAARDVSPSISGLESDASTPRHRQESATVRTAATKHQRRGSTSRNPLQMNGTRRESTPPAASQAGSVTAAMKSAIGATAASSATVKFKRSSLSALPPKTNGHAASTTTASHSGATNGHTTTPNGRHDVKRSGDPQSLPPALLAKCTP